MVGGGGEEMSKAATQDTFDITNPSSMHGVCHIYEPRKCR